MRTTVEEKLLEHGQVCDRAGDHGLTDKTHPCQLMADVMTVRGASRPIQGKAIAGRATATTWRRPGSMPPCSSTSNWRIACPPELSRRPTSCNGRKSRRGTSPSPTTRSHCARRRLRVTDTWVSMATRIRRAQARRDATISCAATRFDKASDGAGQEGRHLHALPAGASRRGSGPST